MSQPTIDKDWFTRQLADNRKSLRGLARHMGIDPSAASRMLSGTRRMKMEEATEIARFLNAPVSEVLKHAGVAVDLDGNPSRVILAALIDEHGNVTRLTDAKPLPPGIMERARSAIATIGNGKIIAAQIRATSGPLAIWDDAVLLFSPTERVEPAAIGALAVCRTMSGDQILVRVERARKTGEASVRGADQRQDDIMLQNAAPVIVVLP